MYKYTTTLLALLLPVIALAGNPVSRTDAERLAGEYFSSSRHSGTTKTSAAPLTLVKTASDNEFYIYNRKGGGFVIVSGDDAVGPYLAYSDEGEFRTANMPANLRHYLDLLAYEVRTYRNDPSKKSITPTASSETILTTAKWDQDTPYNNLSPVYNGYRSVTGCVATAMAIVMQYNKWPERGRGTLPSYTTYTHGIRMEGYELGHSYDWSNMPDKYTVAYTQEQADQVAQLMLDCGMMVRMDYSPYGSGAYSQDVRDAIIEYMDYDPACMYLMREMFTDDDWFARIKESIDDNCPLIYSSYGAEGGHEYVVDGYNSSNMVHVNFGWSGSGNGFYKLTDMGGMSQGQDAIFHVRKPQPGGSEGEPLLYMSGKGLSIQGNYTSGQKFTVKSSYIYSYGSCGFTGTVGLALVDFDGNIKSILASRDIYDLAVNHYSYGLTFDVQAGTQIRKGEGLQLFMKPQGSDSYEPVVFNPNNGTAGIIYPEGQAGNFLELTSVTCEKATGKITVTMPTESVRAELKDDSGSGVSFGTEKKGNKFIISTADLRDGIYKLVLSRDGENEKTIRIPVDNSKRLSDE